MARGRPCREEQLFCSRGPACRQLLGKAGKSHSQTLNLDFAASFGAAERAAGPLQHGGGLDARAPLCAYALHHPLEGCGASARQGMAAFWRSFTNGCLGHAGMAHCVRSSLLDHTVPTALLPAARSTMATSLWWSPVHGRRRTSGDHLLAAWIRCASKIGRCRLHSALRHRAGSNSL